MVKTVSFPRTGRGSFFEINGGYVRGTETTIRSNFGPGGGLWKNSLAFTLPMEKGAFR
jgi:hypothetical protein